MATPTLETDRLVLRPVTLKDAPAIQKYFDNWNIVRYLPKTVPWPYPANGAEEHLRNKLLPAIASGEALVWAIFSKEGPKEAIGVINFRFKEQGGGNRGFWLAEPFWSKGYMTEAVTVVQDYLFFDLGIDRFFATNSKANKGSRRVKEKTGARYLGAAQLEDREGGLESERWDVTFENWASLRGRKC